MIDDDQRQKTALFRFGVIADLVQLAPGTPGIYGLMAVKADREYRIPGSSRTRIAMDTIRDWLGLYRAGGFEALLPKPRCDAGRPGALPDALVESLLGIKEQHRGYSVREVIRQVRALGHVPAGIELPPSSVHRLFSRHGLMQKAPEDPSSNDRRHFQFEKAGDLWMSDVMHSRCHRRRQAQSQGLPHRLSRRCHSHHSLCRLRSLGEHRGVSRGLQAGADAPGPANAPVRR